MKDNRPESGLFPNLKRNLAMFKFTCVLLAFTSFHSMAGLRAQTVTLQMGRSEITQVLSRIEQQTNVRFLFNSRLKDLDRVVEVDFVNKGLDEVLGRLFAGTGLTYRKMENNLVIIRSSDPAEQDIRVTGRVVNEAGEPVSAASVMVKGRQKGVLTDNDGRFEIYVPENTVLLVTAVGYASQEVPVSGQSQLNVRLSQSYLKMDEMVVVGYGTQRRRDLTTATSQVKGEELVRQPVVNVAQALQGKSSGVQVIGVGKPGESPVVVIRGIGTALGTTNVLYVVDGMLTDNITNINTNDIVNVDILKDASATAIYGSRGANGVVLITTKKGVAGKNRLEYATNIGFREASNMVRMANAEEYDNYYRAASGQEPGLPTGTSTDWYGEILRKGFYQNHNLSYSGGNEKALHYLNLSYLDENGIVITNNFKRFTVRLNEEFRLSSKLRLGIQSSFTNSQGRDVDLGAAYNDAYRATPLIPSRVDGKYGNTSVYQNVGNPLLDIYQNNIRKSENRLQATSYIQYNPVKWITLKSSLGTDLRYNDGKTYQYKFFADTSFFLTPGGNQQSPTSALGMNNGKTFWWVWDNTATFSRKIGTDHDFSLLLGTTAEKFKFESLYGFRRNVPENPDLWYLTAGDPNTSINNAEGDYWAHNSYFGRLNYNFRSRYFLTASLRADGTSRLPEKNRWRYYPAVSAAWMVTNEEFMSGVGWVDVLKLRAGWGRVGNENIPTNSFQNTFSNGYGYAFQSGGTARNGMVATRIVDENITWEETTDIELGVDFALLDKRLNGEVNFYDKNVENALFPIFIPATAGSSYPVISNVATINNRGMEVSLAWKDEIRGGFGYSIGGNLTFNRNEVTRVNFPSVIIDGGIGASQQYTTVTRQGLPIGSFSAFQVLGVFQNQEEIFNYKSSSGVVIQNSASPGDFKYRDVNDDGRIDENDRVAAGAYQPKMYFNVNLGANFRRIDFSMDVYGVTGNKVYNGKKAFRQNLKDNIEREIAYSRWVPGSNINDEPAANGGQLPASTYFVESGTFFRINNATLGYTMPEGALSRYGISFLRFYATVQNAYTYKLFSGFSPELPGSPTDSGIERNAYPTTRTYALGLNVSF